MIPSAWKDWVAIVIWMTGITLLAWVPGQDEFHIIFPLLVIAFGSYAYASLYSSAEFYKWALIIAVIVRVLVIPAFPNLSDDIFRFIWDGRLWHYSVNPFTILPSELVNQHSLLNQDLFEQLNSQNYFSIYPPIAQFIFWISTFYPSSDLHTEAIMMKSIHVAFDLGTLYLLKRLLQRFGFDRRRILLYALNPLIIVELIGNLHHEGIMIFFVLLSLWFISTKHFKFAGMAIAGAVATKLLPLMLCPLLFFYLKGKNRWVFTLAAVITSAILFLPILSEPEVLGNLANSADLYLRKFEFNGSIYYLYKGFGYLIYGYNMIHVIGPLLMSVTIATIFIIASRVIDRDVSFRMLIFLLMMTYSCYVLLSITIHPWYIAILIPLCIFTRYRTPILWSGLIMLTYINYSFEPYHEVLWIVFTEYVLVFALLMYEIFIKSPGAKLCSFNWPAKSK